MQVLSLWVSEKFGESIVDDLPMTTVKTPHDLLAAVPFLIGYHPTNSLVLISVKKDALEMAMRIDYPINPPDGTYQLLASHLQKDQAEAALVIAYEPSDHKNGEEVLQMISEAISKTKIPIRELMLVRDGSWRSLLCTNQSCCPVDGTPMQDFHCSRIAAEQVANGKVLPYLDAQSLGDSISATSFASDLNWCAQVLKFGIQPDDPDLNSKQRDGAEAIHVLADFYIQDGASTDLDLKARVLGRLSDIQVRDYALGCHDQDSIEAYSKMWRDLLRIAPTGFVAPVASLFAAIAYENGDGALAHRALDRAIADNAEYSLSRLLRRVFSSGWPPTGFAQLRSELHPRVTKTIFSD